jgi:predicted TIM-barrel enzyme
MERLPTEVALTETVKRFKAIPAHREENTGER